MSETHLGVLLTCFDDVHAAAKARRPLDKSLRSAGHMVVDTVILKVTKNAKASVHDPRRDIAGAATSALTWGLFGLIASGGWTGLLTWAVLGAICGGGYAYLTEHTLTKHDLHQIGRQLPPDSSAFVAWIETTEPENVLANAAAHHPAIASVAAIDPDLSTRIIGTTPLTPGTPTGNRTPVTMVLLRYPGQHTARRVWAEVTGDKTHQPPPIQTELLCAIDTNGKAQVDSPSQGIRAMANSDVISWGLFGIAFGAAVGLAGGGGILGFLEQGIATGVAWAAFGLVAGALYGMWAGRAVSARRLKSLAPLLPPDTSLIVAWAGTTTTHDTLSPWTRPGSQHLTLRFDPVAHGAVLNT